MRLPFVDYGRRELMAAVVFGVVGAALCLVFLPLLTPLPLLIVGFVVYFFRDPEREVPNGEQNLVSPADGKVVEIAEVHEPNYIKGPAVKVSIFLSVFNCHVNRSPVSGRVQFLKYQMGKFKSAFRRDAPRVNETNMIGIARNNGDDGEGERILVKQIAGAIARRIVCGCDMNDELERGERIGMIKFGSRTEVYIPKTDSLILQIKKGDKVTAGETILGIME